MDRDACDAWLTRVLSVTMTDPGASTLSAQRGREAKASNPRGIAYPKLLLRWRSAQAAVAESLNQIARDLLSRQEVIEDPRFEDVKKCAALLPTLVPKFGGDLEDAIDQGINEGQGPRAAEIAAKAVSIIGAYRQQLAGAAQFRQLATFAANDLGSDAPLVSELDAALSELSAQLANAA